MIEVIGPKGKGLKAIGLLLICNVKDLVQEDGDSGDKEPPTSRPRDEDTREEEGQE